MRYTAIDKGLDRQLMGWWQWYERLPEKATGFPSDYNLDIVRSLQPSGTIVPLVDIPRGLEPLDRAMRVIDSRLWTVLAIRHWVPGTDEQRCAEVGMSKGCYRRMLDLAYSWLDGYMRRQPP